jgi:hypothetical protein
MNEEEKGKIALADFFMGYSEMDRAVGDAIKAMLKVKGSDEDLVVAALGNFAKRADVVLAGLETATTFGATKTGAPPDLNERAREEGKKALKRALGLNVIRVKLAHGHLLQNDDGSFTVTHLNLANGEIKNVPDHIGVAQLQEKTEQMLKVIQSIRDLARELSNVIIELQPMNLDVSGPQIAMSATLTVNDAGDLEEK